MAGPFVCPQGHQWTPVPVAHTIDEPDSACPVCGAEGLPVTPPSTSYPHDADSEVPTPALPLGRGLETPPQRRDTKQPGRDPAEAETPSLPGAQVPAGDRDWPVIPGYQIVDQLGQGGMGIVYKARQLALKREVALKVIKAGSYAGPEHLARFRAEAESAARLQHPNIVQVHEVGEWRAGDSSPPLPFIALEFVDGGSLANKLAGQPLPPRVAAQLSETLARAMHYAHQHGIVHRDLKPGNILLQRSEIRGQKSAGRQATTIPSDLCPLTSDLWPKISDFGLAKQLHQDSSQTHTGQVLGTPNYMAPEQALGKIKEIGPVSDVYALGALLYETMTGRPPFTGASMLEILEQVRSQEPVPPTRLQPRLPRDLETICLKCLQKEPRKRYADAQQLADDLHRYLAGEPIHARPTPAWERVGKWARRRPDLATSIVLLVLITALGFGLVYWKWRDAEARREEAERARRDAQLLTARTALGRGLSLCEMGDTSRGMLWLARSLELTADLSDADAAELRQTIRANLAGWRREVSSLEMVLTQRGHVMAFALSPDGNRAAVGCGDGTAQVYDLDTGQPLGPPLKYDRAVWTVAFSLDGKLLLTGYYDYTARLWDVATGQRIGETLEHRGHLIAVAFHPDGKAFLTSSTDGMIHRWDLATGEALSPSIQHPGRLRCMALSPDGKTIAGGGDEAVHFWESTSGLPLHAPLVHPGHVRAVGFSADGELVATGCADQKARIWKPATREWLGPPLPHEDAVVTVSFSADGKLLVTGSEDQTARMWDVASGQPLGPRLYHQGWVMKAVCHPDGRRMVTGSLDRTLRVWAVPMGTSAGPPLAHPQSIWAVAISGDGKTVATGGNEQKARLWDAATGQPIGQPMPHGDVIMSLALSPDRKVVATGGGDKTVQLWDAATGQRIGEPLAHPSVVISLAFSPEGRTLMAATATTTVHFWDVKSAKPVGRVLEHPASIRSVALSPDGKMIVTGSSDHMARLWSVATGQLLGTPLEERSQIRSVAFSPGGRMIATGTENGHARLWSIATGKPVGPVLPHQGVIWAVAFSPDGRTLLTASEDRTARLWSVATGQPIGPPLRHDDAIRGAIFAPDGRTVWTASQDKTVRPWLVPHFLSPPRVGGDTEGGPPDDQLTLWTQVVTGMELDADDVARVLDPATWQERRRRLESMGGGPLW